MLKANAFHATLWSGADVILRQGVQFITLVLLARLLLPADFGLIAMLSLITGTATVLVDGGLSVALIQRKHITPEDESTVFYFNVATGATLTSLIFFAAPWIATFYNSPELVTPTRVMAFSCLLGALSPVHTALLSRNLNFATQAKASIFATSISSLIAVILAHQGAGIMALALHSVLTAGLLSMALWWLHSWRPKAIFCYDSLRDLASFGSYHMSAGLLDMFYSRLHTPLLGRIWGAEKLGLYSQADSLRQLPGNFLTAMVNRVALPLFSANKENPAVLRRGLQLSLRTMMLFHAPIMLGMSVIANSLLPILLGPHWQAAASSLSILCLAGFLYPLNALNIQLLLALGHSRQVFKLQILKTLIGISLLAFGLYFGMQGVAWSQVALSIISLYLNTRHAHRLLDFGIRQQIREILPCTSVAAATCALVLLWHYFGPRAPSLEHQLIYEMVLGAISYTLLTFALRLEAAQDTLTLLQLLFRHGNRSDAR